MPSGPTKSVMRYEVYRNKNSSDEDFETINSMYKRIMSEDKYLCANAQKNLNTGVFVNGEMHPRMEKGPLYFQKGIRDTVTQHYRREKESGQEIWPARQVVPESDQEDISFCAQMDKCVSDNTRIEQLAF